MKKISIIIPMYNVARFLKHCIFSIQQQHMNNNEYEVIMVDDGSPDNSKIIANELALSDSTIKVVSQKNKGLGGARNTGIKNAQGKYIIFLDADDLLVENTLSQLITISDKNNLEILEFGASRIDEDGSIIDSLSMDSASNIYNGITYYKKIKYMGSACNKLYKTNFLRNNNLYFLEHIYGEDFEFNTRVLYYTKRIMAIPLIAAKFLQSDNSITRNSNKLIKDKYIRSYVKILENLTLFKKTILKDTTVNTNVESFFLERLTLVNINVFFLMVKNNYSFKEIYALKQELKQKNIFFANHSVSNKKKNAFRIILLNNFYLLKLTILVKNKLNKSRLALIKTP